MEYRYIDINKRMASDRIDMLFPGWQGKEESVCVLSPHDDDALIGAGYAISAALENRAEVFVFIFCRGNAGYSSAGERESIEETRRAETINSYGKLGLKRENIIRFDYSDFSMIRNIGWIPGEGGEGSFRSVVTAFRKFKITRLLVPNNYREHIDHTAVSAIGTYYAPQTGDPVVPDWCKPHTIKSTVEYSVWADLSPEDSAVCGRDSRLRANRVISVNEEVERKICESILQYKSQLEIIKDLLKNRAERRCRDGRYIEIYLDYDPRPKLDYEPYKEFIGSLPQEPE